MKLVLVSDLHLEFSPVEVRTPGDVLVLAGDVAPLHNRKLPEFLKTVAKRYKRVVWVAGNHEFYGNDIGDFAKFEVPANVVKLDNSCTVVDGVKFIGTTLWSDLRDPLAAFTAGRCMNDYAYIKNGGGLLTPGYSTLLHMQARNFLETEITPGCVVVTHHGPSYASVNERYAGDRLNAAYVSNLDYLFDRKARLWCHGHTHFSVDYNLGTRVVANPRGYPGENRNWKPKVIKL